MTGDAGAQAGLALAIAAGGFGIDLALSVMMLSASALSRVALRRLNSESGGRLPFLDEFKTVPSSHRAAIHLVRELGLLLGTASTGFAALRAGVPGGVWTGLAVGGVFGTIVVETVLARLLALRDPRTALRITAILARPIHAATYPLLAPVHAAFRRWARTIEEDDDREEGQAEDVEAFIEVGEREGILEKDEGKMVRGIVDLNETLIREVMKPRVDVVVIPVSASVAEARRIAVAAGHSRFPVFGDTIDAVVGILHVRDLLRAWHEGWGEATIAGLVRPAVFVPETRTVAEVLAELRTRGHVALVVDEYGGFAGLVTLEDLVEEIVGEIRDEHEREEEQIVAQPDGSWLLSGLAHVEELERLFGLDLAERDYDTVGGFVTATLGRVPARGETVEARGLTVEVVDADPRRIFRVRIHPARAGAPIERPR